MIGTIESASAKNIVSRVKRNTEKYKTLLFITTLTGNHFMSESEI